MRTTDRPAGGGKSPANGMRVNCVDTLNAPRRTWHKCDVCGNEYRTRAKASKCCKDFKWAR